MKIIYTNLFEQIISFNKEAENERKKFVDLLAKYFLFIFSICIVVFEQAEKETLIESLKYLFS